MGFFGLRHCRHKGLRVCRKLWGKKKTTTTTRQRMELYLRGDVLLWFPLSPSAATTCLLNRSDPGSAAGRAGGGKPWASNETNPCSILPEIADHTSVWIVNVAFSWALFGNGAWWRERGDVSGALTSRRDAAAVRGAIWTRVRELINDFWTPGVISVRQ